MMKTKNDINKNFANELEHHMHTLCHNLNRSTMQKRNHHTNVLNVTKQSFHAGILDKKSFL